MKKLFKELTPMMIIVLFVLFASAILAFRLMDIEDKHEQEIRELNKQIDMFMIDTESGRTIDSEYEVLRAIYRGNYLIECENGMSYDLDRKGNWYDGRGNVVYNIDEKVTVVVSADTVIAIIRDTVREG